MLQDLLNLFNSDCRYIVKERKLLASSLGLLLIVIILKLLFPLSAAFIYSKTGFQLIGYYSLVAITLIAVIPLYTGILYAGILRKETGLNLLRNNGTAAIQVTSPVYIRLMTSLLISFFLVIGTAFLTDPVPSEGWLRTLLAAFILSLQAPFVCLFLIYLAENKRRNLIITLCFGLILLAVPLGPLLHHPFNYIAFISPLYWLAWTWLVQSATESITYGSIALILTLMLIILLLCRLSFRNKSG
jgi:hypothetical protein